MRVHLSARDWLCSLGIELGGACRGRVQLLLCGVQFMGLGENVVAWGLMPWVGPLSPWPAVQGFLGRA